MAKKSRPAGNQTTQDVKRPGVDPLAGNQDDLATRTDLPAIRADDAENSSESTVILNAVRPEQTVRPEQADAATAVIDTAVINTAKAQAASPSVRVTQPFSAQTANAGTPKMQPSPTSVRPHDAPTSVQVPAAHQSRYDQKQLELAAKQSEEDRKASGDKAGPLGLDVRMLWRGDTHAAQFFPRPVPITLGENGTFALPPEVMAKNAKELTLLVEPHPTAGFALRVDNPAAQGHILVDGKSYELAAVRAGQTPLTAPAVPLTATTHAYVVFGDFTFLLSRTVVPPPPPLSLWDRENTIFLLCLLAALALLGGPLWAGFNSAEYRNRAKLSYLEQVEQDLRKPETIEVLIQEEKAEEKKEEAKVEEKKEAEPAPLQAEKKPEEKKADELTKQLKDLNEEEKKDKIHDIVKDEMAKNTAQIDEALKDVGGPTTKLFAEDDGAGAQANTNLGQDTSDRNGAALAGDPNGGRRGPGDGSETGRQANAGLGKDANAAGKDPKLDVHEKQQSLVRVGGSVGDTSGELPKAVIKAYIATKMGAIKACYQKGLQSNPDLSGKIKVKFLIQPNGAVNPAKIDDSSINNDGVENCVLNNVKAWKFPQAKGGGVTTVVYPFVFASH